MTDNITPVLPINPDAIAEADALADMEEEFGGDLVEAYFGAAIVVELTDPFRRPKLINLFITDATSYEEAVGMAYLDTREEYSEEEGWELIDLKMDEQVVWVEKEDESDFSGLLDMSPEDTFESASDPD